MPDIETVARPVFQSPTMRRCFLTARAAANGEARAQIERKYPTERADYEGGHLTYPGWHWSLDERLVRVHQRLARNLLRRLREKGRA